MPSAADPGARWLERGLAAHLALAPLPFGSVHAGGRLLFEAGAWVLLALWAVRGRIRANPVPPRGIVAGLILLTALAWVQSLPLGPAADLLAPAVAAERRGMAPPPGAAAAERNVLATDPSRFDRPGSLSVDAPASASATRTAAAYVALALVAWTVVSLRGAKGIAAGLLAGGVFQALYGILVLASGHARIWNVPKTAYLESATGTFVNRNHYAAYLALVLAAGAGLLLSRIAALPSAEPGRPPWNPWTGGKGARTILVAAAMALVAAGLLVSFSRAGISVGLAALAAAMLASGVPRRRAWRGAILAVTLLVASVPILSLGAGPLAARFASAERDFTGEGGRAVVWSDTLRLVVAHPVFGCGLGAFAQAYPPVRSPGVRVHYTHAHNDWLQFAAESGLAGSVLLLAILVAVARPWLLSITGRRGPLAAGFAAGIGAFAAHAAIDFPGRIPAVLGAVIAAAAALAACPAPDSPTPGPALRLTTPETRRRGPGAAILVAFLAAVALSTGPLGARSAREPASPWGLSADAARAALVSGGDAPAVRESLFALRGRLGSRPLDADTRAAYAAVLLEASFGTPDVAAAAFHARAAAERSPVSLPVVSVSADVLLRAGHPEEAVAWIRSMFSWDPGEAASLLERFEPLLPPLAVRSAIPDDPEAWEARAARLDASGRRDEARDFRALAFDRWPDRIRTRVAAADDAIRTGDREAFLRIVPPGLRVEEGRDSAALLAHRARARGLTGDLDGARSDARGAVRAGGAEPGVLLRAGDALAAAGDRELAREMWVRALHGSRAARIRGATIASLSRIARLDETEGREGDAFRAWREVLSLDPSHREARARTERLTGSDP